MAKRTPDQATDLRQYWGKNLTKALSDNDLTPMQFHRRLLDQGVNVTAQAVYYWLAGRYAPIPAHQVVIGRVLYTPPTKLFPLEVA